MNFGDMGAEEEYDSDDEARNPFLVELPPSRVEILVLKMSRKGLLQRMLKNRERGMFQIWVIWGTV